MALSLTSSEPGRKHVASTRCSLKTPWKLPHAPRAPLLSCRVSPLCPSCLLMHAICFPNENEAP